MLYLCFDTKNELNFSSAGRFVAVEDYIHSKRKLPEAVLLLGFAGECQITQEGKTNILKKGDFQILFPNHTHFGTDFAKKGQSHFWCHFHLPNEYWIAGESQADEFRKKGYCVIPEFYHLQDIEKYYVLFSQLIDSAESECFNGVVCNSFLKILLCSIAENCEFKNSSNRKLVSSKLKELILFKNYKNISISEASKALVYNPNYLSRIIKNETGLAPVEYINTLKIKNAKNLLINSNMRVSMIAQQCGFADEKYFLKVFKKYENVTPTQYRNAYFRKNLNKE